MAKAKKLSASKSSRKLLSIKSTALPSATEKKISAASQIASERIAHNNQVYASSNSNASYYATK